MPRINTLSPFTLTIRALLLLFALLSQKVIAQAQLAMVSPAQTEAVAGTEKSFVEVQSGTAKASSLELEKGKAFAISQGKAVGLTFQESEIVNGVKVSTGAGEVLLMTKSLDKMIVLPTGSLGPGEYLLEITSGGQKLSAKLLVR